MERDDNNQMVQNRQSVFEGKLIDIFTLDPQNRISTFTQPFRIAFDTYLNKIQGLNHTANTSLMFNFTNKSLAFLQGNPSHALPVNITLDVLLRDVQFLLFNGPRGLHDTVHDASEYQKTIAFDSVMNTVFLIMLILGSSASILSTTVMVYKTWSIEKNKADILSLYALLKMEDIKLVYDKSEAYLENLY